VGFACETFIPQAKKGVDVCSWLRAKNYSSQTFHYPVCVKARENSKRKTVVAAYMAPCTELVAFVFNTVFSNKPF